MMLCSYFDKVYCISIDGEKTRQQHIRNLFDASELKNCLQIFNAVNGKKIDIRIISNQIITQSARNDIESLKQQHYGISLTYGSLGCALSHYLIYKECAKSTKPFLIFEDDISIDKTQFDTQLDDIIKNTIKLRLVYDILYLGLHKLQCLKKHHVLSEFLCKPSGCMYGTFGMIVTPYGAKKILDIVFPLTYQIDGSIARNSSKLNILATIDDIVDHSHNFGSLTQREASCINLNK